MITCSFLCGGARLLLHDAETAFHDIVEKIGLPRGAGTSAPHNPFLSPHIRSKGAGNLP